MSRIASRREAGAAALVDREWIESSRFASQDDPPERPAADWPKRSLRADEGIAREVVYQWFEPIWLESAWSKIQGLLRLEKGWDSYGAQCVSPQIAHTAVELLPFLWAEGTPEPHIVPTASGGIQFEWNENSVDLELEILSPSHIEVLVFDHETHSEIETALDNNDWRELKDLLKPLAEKRSGVVSNARGRK